MKAKRYHLELTKGELKAIWHSLSYWFDSSGSDEILQMFGSISLQMAGERAFNKVGKTLFHKKENKNEPQITK